MMTTTLPPAQRATPIGSIQSALYINPKTAGKSAIIFTRELEDTLVIQNEAMKSRRLTKWSFLILILALMIAGVIMTVEIGPTVTSSIIVVVGLLVPALVMLWTASRENRIDRQVRKLLFDEESIIINDPSRERLIAIDKTIDPSIVDIALTQLETVHAKIIDADTESASASPEELYEAMRKDITDSVVLTLETAHNVERSHTLSTLRDEILPGYTHKEMTTKIVHSLGADIES